MRESERFTLQDSQTNANNAHQEASDIERPVFDSEQADSRQIESKRTKLFVLIGSGILQLPIWGMFGFFFFLFLYDTTYA